MKIGIKTGLMLLSALILLTIVVVIRHDKEKEALSKSLSKERLANEQRLSEKLQLEKEIKDFKQKLASYQGKNAELDKYLTEMKDKLAKKEQALATLSIQQSNERKLRDETSNLKKLRADLDKKMSELTTENATLVEKLKQSDLLVANLRDELSAIQNPELGQEKNVLADNYRLETLKKNDKLTVRAKKTGKMIVSFDTPAKELASYNLVVKEQSGADLKGKIVMTSHDIASALYASNSDPDIQRLQKRIELKFTPEQPMKRGIYAIQVFENNILVGNAQVRLEK